MRPLEEKKRPLGWIFLSMLGFLLIGWAFFYFYQMLPDPTVVNSRGEITLGNSKFNSSETESQAVAVRGAVVEDSLASDSIEHDSITGNAIAGTAEILLADTISEVVEPSLFAVSDDPPITIVDAAQIPVEEASSQEVPESSESPESRNDTTHDEVQIASIEKTILDAPAEPKVEKVPVEKAPVKVEKPTPTMPIETKPIEVKPKESKSKEVSSSPPSTQIMPYSAKCKGDKMKVMGRITGHFQNLGYLHKIIGGKITYRRVVLPEVSEQPLDITFYMLKGNGNDRMLVGLFHKSNGGGYLSPDKYPVESTRAQQFVSRLAR